MIGTSPGGSRFATLYLFSSELYLGGGCSVGALVGVSLSVCVCLCLSVWACLWCGQCNVINIRRMKFVCAWASNADADDCYPNSPLGIGHIWSTYTV